MSANHDAGPFASKAFTLIEFVVRGPGRPRDYSLELPQIRTGTLMHPVRHGVEYRCPSHD
jgi:hypothetical protein